MIFWWLGVILAEVYAGGLNFRLWHIAPFGLLILPLVPMEFLFPPQSAALRSLAELAWSAAFAGLIAGLLAWRNRGGSLRAIEVLRPLAPFSYTLYVTHFPILLFLCGWLLGSSPYGRLPVHVGWVLPGAGICLAVAYAAHFVVERPFLSRRKPNPASAVMVTGVSPPSAG
jgi:peptidoglycan/LPS O-acetylase OafA/YrhL